VMPGPNSDGVKITLPSVRRMWVFSMLSVPGCCCRSSVLCVKCTPSRVASSSWCSKSPNAPSGPYSCVVRSQFSITDHVSTVSSS
jgi:hypothetical protein